MIYITALAECYNYPSSPFYGIIPSCAQDICAGGDPHKVYCSSLDAVVELCEDLTRSVITGAYRQDAGCGMCRSIHESSILY